LDISIVNADKDNLAPRIDTPVSFRYASVTSIISIHVERDPFPAFEMYHLPSAGGIYTVFQDVSGGQAAFSLIPPAGDHNLHATVSI